MGDINTNSSDSLTETIGGTRVAKREVDTEYVFKIVVLGDYNVGKTTLIHRLLHTSLPSKHTHKHENKDKTMKTHNKWKGKVNVAQEESSDESDKDDNDIAEMDMEHISPTIGVEFFAKFIPHIHPHINVRLQFWDTAGLTRYATLDNQVYRHASLILCVFDVTQKDSLEHIVSQHLVHVAEFIPELEQDKIIVVGNKLDLLHDNVNAFTELLNNYHRHRRPDAAFLTSHISASSFHGSNNNNVIKNNNIASMNGNVDNIMKLKSNAITTNEGINTDAINDAIVNDNNVYNDLLYSSSDDNTSTNETTNTNTSNNINRTTHSSITKQQRRQARWEAEAHNSVITQKDVYECLLNDFDDIKYLTVSARSNINMSRLLELMCDVLLCQVTDAHYERNRDERVHEHEEHENVSVEEREECVNKDQNNIDGNTREEIGTSRASCDGIHEIKDDNNKEHVDLEPSSMPLNIPVVALQECDRTPHYNSYNVGCWSNNNGDTLSFNLSPQEQTATFVESSDNLYSPQEGKDVSMAPEHKMQRTQCEHNFSNSENNNTSMSVTISATQLIESTSQAPENIKMENVLDTHEKINKEIKCNNVKLQIVHTEINQDNIRVIEDKDEEATCLHQENTINTFTNYTRDNAQVIQKAQLSESQQESVETNLLEEQQDENEIIRPRVSLLDQIAHELEQQRQQANITSNNINSNNNECNDDGMNLQEYLRDRFTAIEAESKERCEANKTKHCKDNNNNNSSTLAHNTINTSHNNSSPVMNVAQRYKKDKKHICRCGSLSCICMEVCDLRYLIHEKYE